MENYICLLVFIILNQSSKSGQTSLAKCKSKTVCDFYFIIVVVSWKQILTDINYK